MSYCHCAIKYIDKLKVGENIRYQHLCCARVCSETHNRVNTPTQILNSRVRKFTDKHVETICYENHFYCGLVF